MTEKTKFGASAGLFMYVQSSLRVGTGEPTAETDLPLYRQATTGYPLLPASSLKGAFRGRARAQQAAPELMRLLGSASEEDEPQPSSVVVSDAVPLLFPVRSLSGLFAWTTSADVWSHLQRDLAAYGIETDLPPLPNVKGAHAAVPPESGLLTAKQTLVLEELSFATQTSKEMAAVGKWLSEHVFPEDAAFAYWRERMAHSVVLLPEDDYRFFVQHCTQTVKRIRIDPQTMTAADGSLWAEEYMPPETVLYAMVGANLADEMEIRGVQTAADVLKWFKGLSANCLQLGSGKTIGHGFVWTRWLAKAATPRRTGRRKKTSA